ncbi:MAG: inorganic phosphate transporter [Methanobacteriota archaeon]
MVAVEILVGLILLALLFDFYNGMNDAANAVATVVSTRALPPLAAVLMAGFFNFAALFVYGTAVAKAIGSGIVDPTSVTASIEVFVFATLVGAISWAAFATHAGLPVSISHCLIGGLIGAGVADGGLGAILWGEKVSTTVQFIVLSPLIGGILGYVFVTVITRLVRNHRPGSLQRPFKKLQLVSSAWMALSHGGNDAQKTAGIIAFLLIGAGLLSPDAEIPFFAMLMSYTVIGLGTAIGGWKVIRTLGMRVTDLKPHQGFAAETAGALTLAGTAFAGIPVSTTHTISGAIVGVGAQRRFSAVRWGVTRRIFGAWVLTIPASAVVAYVSYFVVRWMLSVS